MEFDNAQFEQAANNTISTLAKLEDSLQFSNGASGIDDIQRSIDDLDVSKVEDAIDKINQQFSIMGMAGKRVIEDLTDSMYKFVTNTVSNAWNSTIGQMKSGGWTRASNIASAKFMLEGIGIEWKDVFESINYAVADTAYGLDEAAKACSQFAVSGVQLGQDMSDSLRAVSGVAAMTNSEYSDIAQIFTTIAGQGKVMAYQLNQLSFRGLNAAAILGEQMGVTEAEVREMVHEGEIDFKTFAEAMDNAFGEHAKDANKTFSGAMANIKASMNKIGEVFAAPYIENMVPLLNDVRLFFNAVKQVILGPAEEINAIIKNVIEMASGVVQSGRSFLFRFLDDDQLRSLGVAEEKIAEIRAQFEKPLELPFSGVLEKVSELVKGIHDVFLGVGDNDISLFNTKADSEKLASKIGGIFQQGGITVDNQGLVTQVDLLEKLTETGYNFWRVEEIIAEATGAEVTKFEELSNEQLKSAGYTWEQIKALRELQTASGYDFFSKAIEGTATVEDLTQAVDELTSRGGELRKISGIPAETKAAFEQLADQVRRFNEEDFSYTINDILTGAVDNLFGNVDLSSRQITAWTDSLKTQFRDELSYWDFEPSLENLDAFDSLFALGNYSAGGFSQGLDIIFNPMLEDGTPLDSGTVEEYITELIEMATSGGVTDLSLLDALDEEGMMVGETYVNGIIAGIIDAANGAEGGESAEAIARLLTLSANIQNGANQLGIEGEQALEDVEDEYVENVITHERFIPGLTKFGDMVEDTLAGTVKNIVGIDKTQAQGVSMLDDLEKQYLDKIDQYNQYHNAYMYLVERQTELKKDDLEVSDAMKEQIDSMLKNASQAKTDAEKLTEQMEQIKKEFDLTDDIIEEIRTSSEGVASIKYNTFIHALDFMKAPDSAFDNIKNNGMSVADDLRRAFGNIRDMVTEAENPGFFTDFTNLQASRYQLGVKYNQDVIDQLNKQKKIIEDTMASDATVGGTGKFLSEEQRQTYQVELDAVNSQLETFTAYLTKATEARDEFFSTNGLNADTYKGYSAEMLQEFGLTPYGVDVDAIADAYRKMGEKYERQQSELDTLKGRLEKQQEAETAALVAERQAAVDNAKAQLDQAEANEANAKELQRIKQKEQQKVNKTNSILAQIQQVNDSEDQRAFRESLNTQITNAKYDRDSWKQAYNSLSQPKKEDWNQNYSPQAGYAAQRYHQADDLISMLNGELKAYDEGLRQLATQQKLDNLYGQLDELNRSDDIDNSIQSLSNTTKNMRQMYNDLTKLLNSAPKEVKEKYGKILEDETKRLKMELDIAEELMPQLQEYSDEFMLTRANLGVPIFTQDMDPKKITEDLKAAQDEYDELKAKYDALDAKVGKTKADKTQLATWEADLDKLSQKIYNLGVTQTKATSIVNEMSDSFKELFSNAMVNNGEDLAEFLKVLISQLTIGSTEAEQKLNDLNTEIYNLTEVRDRYSSDARIADLDKQIATLEQLKSSWPEGDVPIEQEESINAEIERLKGIRDAAAGINLSEIDDKLFAMGLQRQELANTVGDTQYLIAAYTDAWKSTTGEEGAPELYTQEELDMKGYTNKDFAAAMEWLDLKQEIADSFSNEGTTTENVAAYLSVGAAQLKERYKVLKDKKKQVEALDKDIIALRKSGNKEEADELEKDKKKILGRYKNIAELDKAIEEVVDKRQNIIGKIHKLGYTAYKFTPKQLEEAGYSSNGKINFDDKGYLDTLNNYSLNLAKHTAAGKVLRRAIKEASKPTRDQAMILQDVWKNLDPGDAGIGAIEKIVAGFESLKTSITNFVTSAKEGLANSSIGKAFNTVAGKIGSFMTSVGDIIEETDFDKVFKVFEGLGNFIAIIVEGLGSLAVGIGTILVLIGADLIGAIGGVLKKFSDWIGKEENLNMVTEVTKGIMDKLSDAVGAVGSAFEWAKDKIGNFWTMLKESTPGKAVGDLFWNIGDALRQFFTVRDKYKVLNEDGTFSISSTPVEGYTETNEVLKFYDTMKERIQSFFGLAEDWSLKKFTDDQILPAGRKILDFINGIIDKVKAFWEQFNIDHPNFINDLWDQISKYGNNIINFFTSFFETFTKSEGFEVIKEGFKSLGETILGFFDSVGGIGQGVLDFLFGKKEADGIAGAIDGLTNPVEKARAIGESFAQHLSDITVWIQEKLELIKGKIIEFKDWFVGTGAGKALLDFKDLFHYEETKSIFENISDWFGILCDSIKKKWYDLKDTITAFFDDDDKLVGKLLSSRYTDETAKSYAEMAKQYRQEARDAREGGYYEVGAGMDKNAKEFQQLADEAQAAANKVAQVQATVAGQTEGNGETSLIGSLLGTLFGQPGGGIGAALEEDESILDKSTVVVDQIVAFLDTLGQNIGKLGGGVLGVITGALGGVISAVANLLRGKDLNDIIEFGKDAGTAFAVVSAGRILWNLSSIFSYFKKNQMLKLNPFSISNILKLSLALGVFALALIELAKVPWDRIWLGFEKMAVIMGEFLGIMWGLGKINKAFGLADFFTSLRAISDVLVGTAIGLLAMFGAIKVLTTYAKPEDLIWMVVAFLAPLMTLFVMGLVGHFLDLSEAFVGLGKALEGMAKYLEAIPKIGAFVMLLGWLVSASDTFKKALVWGAAIMGVIVLLTAGILALAKAFGFGATVAKDAEKIGQRIGNAFAGLVEGVGAIIKVGIMVAAIIAIGVAISELAKVGPSALDAAWAIAGLAAAMVLLSVLLSSVNAAFPGSWLPVIAILVGVAFAVDLLSIALERFARVLGKSDRTVSNSKTLDELDGISGATKQGSKYGANLLSGIKSGLGKVGSGISSVGGKIWDGLFHSYVGNTAELSPEEIAQYIPDAIVQNTPDISEEYTQGMFGNMNDSLNQLTGELSDSVSGLVSELGSSFLGEGSPLAGASDIVGELGGALSGVLGGDPSSVVSGVVSSLFSPGGLANGLVNLFGGQGSLIGGAISALVGGGGLTSALGAAGSVTGSFAEQLRALAGTDPETGENGPLYWARSLVAALLGDDANNPDGKKGVKYALTQVKEELGSFLELDRDSLPEGPLQWFYDIGEALCGKEGEEDGGLIGDIKNAKKSLSNFNKFINMLPLPKGLKKWIIKVAGNFDNIPTSLDEVGKLIESKVYTMFNFDKDKTLLENITSYGATLGSTFASGILDSIKQKFLESPLGAPFRMFGDMANDPIGGFFIEPYSDNPFDNKYVNEGFSVTGNNMNDFIGAFFGQKQSQNPLEGLINDLIDFVSANQAIDDGSLIDAVINMFNENGVSPEDSESIDAIFDALSTYSPRFNRENTYSDFYEKFIEAFAVEKEAYVDAAVDTVTTAVEEANTAVEESNAAVSGPLSEADFESMQPEELVAERKRLMNENALWNGYLLNTEDPAMIDYYNGVIDEITDKYNKIDAYIKSNFRQNIIDSIEQSEQNVQDSVANTPIEPFDGDYQDNFDTMSMMSEESAVNIEKNTKSAYDVLKNNIENYITNNPLDTNRNGMIDKKNRQKLQELLPEDMYNLFAEDLTPLMSTADQDLLPNPKDFDNQIMEIARSEATLYQMLLESESDVQERIQSMFDEAGVVVDETNNPAVDFVNAINSYITGEGKTTLDQSGAEAANAMTDQTQATISYARPKLQTETRYAVRDMDYGLEEGVRDSTAPATMGEYGKSAVRNVDTGIQQGVKDSNASSTMGAYGKDAMDNLTGAINSQESTVKASGRKTAASISIGFNEGVPVAAENGRSFIRTIAQAMNEFDVKLVGSSLVNKILHGIQNQDTITYMHNAGVALIEGVLKGIREGEEALRNAGEWAAGVVNNAFTSKQQIHSPSKVWSSFGHYMTGALISSIYEDEKGLKDASLSISQPFENAMYVMKDLSDGDYSFEPSIMPTVDTSDLYNRSNEINDLFAAKSVSLANVSSDLQARNEAELYRMKESAVYNDHNVVAAIGSLRGDINMLNSAIQNMKLYLDTGSLVGGISSGIDRRLGQTKMRRARGV